MYIGMIQPLIYDIATGLFMHWPHAIYNVNVKHSSRKHGVRAVLCHFEFVATDTWRMLSETNDHKIRYTCLSLPAAFNEVFPFTEHVQKT